MSRQINAPDLRKWPKTSYGHDLGLLGLNSCCKIFFLKNLASSVTRYHGQLSSCTISEKTNDPTFRKLSDGWTDEWMDRRTDGRMT